MERYELVFWINYESSLFLVNRFVLDLYSVNIDEKVREDIDKYKIIGNVKKQLFSMPQYYRERERKGIKLPANKIKGQSDIKDIIKVRGNSFQFVNQN